MSKADLLEQTPYRLMVEGSKDLHAIVSMMKRHGVNYDNPQTGMPYIYDCVGVEKLLKGIKVAVKNYIHVGFVLDADLNIANRWDNVRGLLRSADVLDVPDTLPEEGLVIPGRRPDSTIGVWLMPNNRDAGILEDFLDMLIPDTDACRSHAQEACSEARKLGAPFAELSKAQLYTWLSWQEPPGQSFGVAITSRYLRSDTEIALRFVSWFRRVFPSAFESAE